MTHLAVERVARVRLGAVSDIDRLLRRLRHEENWQSSRARQLKRIANLE